MEFNDYVSGGSKIYFSVEILPVGYAYNWKIMAGENYAADEIP